MTELIIRNHGEVGQSVETLRERAINALVRMENADLEIVSAFERMADRKENLAERARACDQEDKEMTEQWLGK